MNLLYISKKDLKREINKMYIKQQEKEEKKTEREIDYIKEAYYSLGNRLHDIHIFEAFKNNEENIEKVKERIDEWDKDIDIEEYSIERYYEYPLSIETGEPEGKFGAYARYLMSWGGPSEEFRVYEGGAMSFAYAWWGAVYEIDISDDLIKKLRIENFVDELKEYITR